MSIFKFAGQTLNKQHFWSQIGDTAPLSLGKTRMRVTN